MVLAIGMLATAAQALAQSPAAVPVTVGSFVRAETDHYFRSTVDRGIFGTLVHARTMASIEDQTVVRMNRDTLYSSGVFDLDAGPVTFTLPEAGARFQSMQVISQDHYTVDVAYGPGRFTYDRARVGTRYVFVIVRTLANGEDAGDLRAANLLQDRLTAEQASPGRFDIPAWDREQLAKVRTSVKDLGRFLGPDDARSMFGTRQAVDPVAHLIGTATGWGGNPREAAVYVSAQPKGNDGIAAHSLTLKDVPVDGFWSISLYNAQGFFEKNDRNAYTLNNLGAKPDPDGGVTVRFGGCSAATPNCLPIMPGWNYTIRLYRPRADVVSGRWQPPPARPVH